MQNSKLMEVIDVLSADELERLQWFLQSPLLNSGAQATELSDLLIHIRKGICDKEEVFALLYPGQSYSRTKIDKLMSALLKQLHHFIVLDQPQPDEALREYFHLLRFYRERGLEKHYQSMLKKVEKHLEAAGRKETLSYWQFRFEEEKVRNEAAKNQRSDDLHVPDLLRELDRFYLLSKLKYAVLLLSQKIHISLNIEDSLQMLEALLSVIEGPEFEDDPPLRAFQQAYRLLRKHPEQDTHAEFLHLRQQLRGSEEMLATDTRKMLHSLLRIHAVGLYNAGRQDYLQAAFELYQEHLKLGYLYYEGRLLPSSFRNIVTLGLRSGALEWVEQFLTEHRHRITGTEYPEEVLSFNRAQLYFFQQRYDEALDQLADKYVELYYQLAARRLEIQILYELRSPILESKIEAFKVYIFRLSQTKLPEKPKEGNNNFLDLLRQVIHPKSYRNPERVKKLQDKLADKKVVAERDWLEAKLQALLD